MASIAGIVGRETRCSEMRQRQQQGLKESIGLPAAATLLGFEEGGNEKCCLTFLGER